MTTEDIQEKEAQETLAPAPAEQAEQSDATASTSTPDVEATATQEEAPRQKNSRAPRREGSTAPRNGQRSPRRDGAARSGSDSTADDGNQLVEKVVYVNRCAKVVKGGRRFSFSALVVVGDQNGKVGHGFGKANEVSDAIRKGTDAAKRAMKKVVVVNETLPHEIYSEFGGAKIVLKPAAPGTGLVAGEKVRAVLEAAGVSNVIAKSLGSSNAANVVKATMQAMLSMRTADQVLSARGKKKKEKESV